MRAWKTPTFIAALTGAAAPAAAHAADLNVSVEIPRLNVAEYHRPYVALWIETPDQTAVRTLSVWYGINVKGAEEGSTWLKDMRTWWRKAGRSLTLQADGVSGPTKAPGKHQLTFKAAQLGKLAPGQYTLAVEAAREVGGREVVRVPFSWPPKAPATASSKGSAELGVVSVTAKP